MGRFRLLPLLLLAPALLVTLGLFAGGLLLAFIQSAGYFAPAGEQTFTLAHYRKLLADGEVLTSLRLTFLVSAISTFVSAVAGLLLALALRELALYSRLFRTLLQVPLAVPHLAMAVALVNVIAPSGLLARLGHAAGFVESPNQFPQLVNDGYGMGIVAAYVLKETPFIALMTLALLVRVGNDYEMAAKTLGASALQRLRWVTLPLAAPAVVSASLVVFAFVFGAFEVPYILGRPYPAMLAVVAQRRFLAIDLAERPEALAIAFLMAAVTAVLVAAYLRLARILIGLERPAVL